MANNGLKNYIIYKKDEGWELARLIHESLSKKHIRVELCSENDNDSVDHYFENEIKPKMNEADIIIIILSRNTLHNLRKNKNSLFSKQIMYCIDILSNNVDNKTIIPIIDDTTFKKPKGKLPKSFATLNSCNTIFTNEKFYTNSINYLYKFIIEQEFKALLKVEGLDTARFNSPKYDFTLLENQKDISPNEISSKVKNILSKKRSLEDYSNNKDRQVFKEIARQYNRPINVLEIGCGNGQFANYVLLDPSIKIKTYMGFDPNKNNIAVAKELFKDFNNFYFNKVNLLDADAYKQMFESCQSVRNTEEWFTKFDIVIFHNVLKNFKYPKTIIATIKDLMYDNASIIIGESDIGINSYHPDDNNLIETFFNLVEECSMCGNMKTGREIFNYLSELQFNNVKLHSIFDPVIEETTLLRKKKEFLEMYSMVKDDYASLIKLHKNNKKYNLAIKWLVSHEKEVKKLVNRKDFFILISYMIWSGRK